MVHQVMQEQNLPIDIHANKLLDWLISRRHCNREWQSQVLVIRQKINNAIQDMPEHPGIIKLLSGSYINYFHVLKIIEILKETEADSKNIFGRYGSQRMKDWQEVAKLYEKDNVYLAEAAQMLTRNINYEIPSLKKHIHKCEQIQEECERKATDYEKNSKTFREHFQASCRQMGIEGKNIKKELVEKLKELPEVYGKAAESIKTLKDVQQFYEEFTKFVVGHERLGGCVPLLKYIMDHGNVTTYEWTYGEPPVKIEEPPINIEIEEEAATEGEAIDFGDGNIDFGEPKDGETQAIDFGEVSLETGDIDWGNTEGGNSAGDIDSGTSRDGMQTVNLNESGIVVEEAGMEGGVARDKDAYSLLDNPKTRSMSTDELLELEAFLVQRLSEMQQESNILSLSQLQDAPVLVQLQNVDSVSAMVSRVKAVYDEVTDQRSQHLHQVKHSPRYVDRLTDTLKQKLVVSEKLLNSRQAVQQRKVETAAQQEALQPKLRLIIEKTKELQAEIEKDISKKYKNRPVNIMGGVSTV